MSETLIKGDDDSLGLPPSSDRGPVRAESEHGVQPATRSPTTLGTGPGAWWHVFLIMQRPCVIIADLIVRVHSSEVRQSVWTWRTAAPSSKDRSFGTRLLTGTIFPRLFVALILLVLFSLKF
jgi:hypothetical protein